MATTGSDEPRPLLDRWRTTRAAIVTDTAGASRSVAAPVRAAVGRIVDVVEDSEWRRVALIAGVSLLFWLTVELAENLGFWPLVVAVGLAGFLYLQKTARETLAASAYGTGVLAVGVGLFLVYQSVAGGSTEPVVDTVLRVSGWPLAGAVLIGIGIWLHSADL